MDVDRFEERAAIMEYDGGLSRFRAETEAAKAQGATRWEALGHVARRLAERARDQRQALDGQPRTDDMPGMQRGAEEENGPVPERDGNR